MTRLRVHSIPWFLSWRGLLGKKPFPILFHTRFGIHTFGMTYPVDVVILDKENFVQTYKENLGPYQFFFWNPRYDTVVELPAGTIKKLNLSKSKKIDLQRF